MKRIFFLLISTVILLVVLCTKVNFNNPVDAKGNSFMGDSAAMDDNGDGIANWFDPTWRQKRDKTPPVIMFHGGIGNGDTVIIQRGDPNRILTTTATVTAVDTGAIKSEPDKITITNSGYFASQCSVYVVAYTATDEAGNSSTKTRIIIVDCDPPLITLVGGNPLNLQVGQIFIDSGATATDNIDGPVTIVKTGTVNTATEHVDTITYTAKDRAGNVATKNRLVVITQAPDTEAPVLTLLGTNPLVITEGTKYTEPGWTAIDTRDGDLHDSVKVTGGPIVTTVPGRDTLTYTVSDKAGNTVAVKRVIVIIPIGPVIDTIPPVIELIGGLTITLNVGDVFVDPGWNAYDLVDGDLTEKVIVRESQGRTINTSAPGNYELLYSVSDSAGNSMEVGRTVIVVGKSTDSIKPVITLDGCVKCTVKLGKNFTEPGYSATDNADGVISANVSKVIKNAAGQVASLTPATVIGDYTITYTVSDKAGNAAVPKVRNVYCKDTFIDPNDLLNKYGVPLPSALPTVNYTYTKVTTDGDGAPNVGTITSFTIAWRNDAKVVDNFAFQITGGYLDLKGKITHTFSQPNPGFTLTGSGITGLDGQYYIKADATQCVWVKKDGKFAIIFKK